MTSDDFSSDPVRWALLKAIEDAPHKTNLKQLSLDLGYNHAYLHQFLYRGSPRILPENARHHLAKILNIPDETLKPMPPHQARHLSRSRLHHPQEYINIFYLDHLSQQKFMGQSWSIPINLLADHVSPAMVKLIALDHSGTGHSLRPTDTSRANTEIVMIDTTDCSPLLAGEFVLDMTSSIRIRHIEQISPLDDGLYITGIDGHHYSSRLSEQQILGRVIFKGTLFHTPTGTAS